jgi:small subunit ribosomal protein S20
LQISSVLTESFRMPVTTSAKKALRVAHRRHEENLLRKDAFKRALKVTRKAVAAGSEGLSELLSKAQSALDKAANGNSIHPNKASRLKSRLAKKLAHAAANPVVAAEAKPKKVAADKKAAAPKKATAAKKAPAKKKAE